MNNNKIKRNIIIFIVGVLILSSTGGIVIAYGFEAGALILVLGPVLMMLLLRYFAGDGFSDAGLSLKFKNKWGWYLFSFLAPPVTITIVILMGMMFGLTRLNSEPGVLIPALFLGLATQFVPRMLLAICEEWGWRGYLEPRFALLGVPDLQRHLFVGFIWAIWHIPLVLSTNYTDTAYVIFFPMFIIGIMISSIVYGQILKASGTVWTAVILHGTSNVIMWAIIEKDLITFSNKVLAFPAPESVFMILLFGIMGWYLYSRLNKENS